MSASTEWASMSSHLAEQEPTHDASSGATWSARVLLVAPSLRIMGGQAVMADRMLRAMRADGLEIDFQPINPRPPGVFALAERVKYLRTLITSLCYVWQLLWRVPRYEVIHLFSAAYTSFLISQVPAILVARLYGKPIVLNYRSGEAEDHLRRWGRVVFPFFRMATRIVVPSDFLVGVFSSFGFPALAIPNVVDPQVVRYRLRRAAAPRIVVPRALEPLYNVACALRTFAIVQARFPDAVLTVLGDGSERRRLQELARELGLRNVEFLGRVERTCIGDLYDQHDILLNTTSIDNTPVSLLEGFAAGIPIVTTNAGGIPYLVEHRVNGYLAGVDDAPALAAAVIELLTRPDEVERLSRQGKLEARKYDWDAVAAKWYELYRTVTSPPSPAESCPSVSSKEI